LLRPVTMLIGNVPLRDLTAQDVRRALAKLAETRSTRTMASTHNVLVRAIRHAEANDHVGRNVASLVEPPRGKTGRPSRAMTAAEAAALLVAASDDLVLELPGLDVDLGEIDHPWLDELRRTAPTSPTGQKRVLAIGHPLVYRLRVSSTRGATWVDEEHGIVWLCAARRREEGSDDDAFAWFADLHTRGALLPSRDDRLRDLAEVTIRLYRGLTADLLHLADDALSQQGTELTAELGGYIPCRVLVQSAGGVTEIWCALSRQARDGRHIRDQVRDILFARLENHFPDAIFEVRSDWPASRLEWWEVVRMGLR